MIEGKKELWSSAFHQQRASSPTKWRRAEGHRWTVKTLSLFIRLYFALFYPLNPTRLQWSTAWRHLPSETNQMNLLFVENQASKQGLCICRLIKLTPWPHSLAFWGLAHQNAGPKVQRLPPTIGEAPGTNNWGTCSVSTEKNVMIGYLLIHNWQYEELKRYYQRKQRSRRSRKRSAKNASRMTNEYADRWRSPFIYLWWMARNDVAILCLKNKRRHTKVKSYFRLEFFKCAI